MSQHLDSMPSRNEVKPFLLDVTDKVYTSGSADNIPCGIYRVYAAATNIPVSDSGYCSTYERENGTKLQTYTTDSNRTFTRTKVNGTWTSWRELALSSNMQWKELGVKTGTEKFSYPPSGWSEVFIQVANSIGYRVNVPINILNASINRNSDAYFIAGNYASASINSSLIIHTDSTGINLYSFYLDGNDLTSTATVRIFYR